MVFQKFSKQKKEEVKNMKKLEIEYVDIDSIKPYENNAKLHPEEQIEQIKQSIEQFGMEDPIGVWNNQIVEGHGRLIACKELGMKEVPIIRLDHLTDEERKAYALVHNKLTMNSDFDFNVLDGEIGNLDIDMSVFGFDSIDVDMNDYGTDFELKDGDRDPLITMSLTFSDEQAEKINEAISKMKQSQTYKDYEDEYNKNSNGNALYLVVLEWLMQKI